MRLLPLLLLLPSISFAQVVITPTECNFTVTDIPPTIESGWRVQFLRGTDLMGPSDAIDPYSRTVRLKAGVYLISARWTREGVTVIKELGTHACPTVVTGVPQDNIFGQEMVTLVNTLTPDELAATKTLLNRMAGNYDQDAYISFGGVNGPVSVGVSLERLFIFAVTSAGKTDYNIWDINEKAIDPHYAKIAKILHLAAFANFLGTGMLR